MVRGQSNQPLNPLGPGGWCNFSTLNCAEYYPRLQHWLLNNNCHIGTIDDLQRDTNSLFAQFSNDSKVFVRPCTVEKVFTGQLVTKDDFAWTLDRARYANCLVLVARPAPISCEWRRIVCRGTAIASSQFRWEGNNGTSVRGVTGRSGEPRRPVRSLGQVNRRWRREPEDSLARPHPA
jgi:hypothetical protein